MRFIQLFLLHLCEHACNCASGSHRLFTISKSLISLLLLCCTALPASAQTLVNGGRVSGAIIFAGQQNSYSFSANTNQRINITVTDMDNNSFVPWVSIYNPDGTYLTGTWAQDVASLANVIAPQNGTYTVVIRDASSGNASTGNYNIYFAKSPDAFELGNLINGGARAEFIDRGDLDTYQFSANTNQRINITVADMDNNSFVPWVSIYNPDGTYLTGTWAQDVASLANVIAPQNGTYTVVIRDASSGNASTGNYNIYFAKSPDAFELGNLINGGVRAEFINRGDLDTYQFSANTNQRINITVADMDNNSFVPWISIYNPDGTYLTGTWAQDVASLANVIAPQNGTYTVVIRDASSGNASTGNYNIYFAKSPDAFELGNLINGGVRAEFIDRGDLDTYQFSANTNERINITVADMDNNSFVPWISIYNPDGTYLTGTWAQDVASLANVTAPQNGTYTVVIRDASSGNASTGNYNTYFAKAPGANEHGLLSGIGSRTQTIERGDLDSYTFVGLAGSKASFTVTDLSASAFVPYITIYDPDGNYLTQTWNQIAASLQNINLTKNGIHTVVIRDASSGNANTGDYLLEFNVPNAPPSNTKPAAVASAPASVYRGEAIVLDASTSYDPDAAPQALSFDWQLTSAPAASALTDADLVNANQAIASFTPDVSGEYRFTLNIGDGAETDTTQVMVVVVNHIPVANAGADINSNPGALITLNGSGSSDADGDLLSYQWQLVAVPENSALTGLTNSGSVTPAFTPDVAGIYSIQLIVNDGENDSVADVVNVIVSLANVAPNLSATASGILLPGEIITLDGSASIDPDNGPQPLTFSWGFTSVPSGSGLSSNSISNANSAVANFTPDVAGTYVLTLTLFDGESSATDTLLITVTPKIREPIACDLNGDFHIDSTDIAMIMARRNQPATLPIDLADWNKDGVINVLDARGCTLQCTLPKCALP